jgi:hypothetical protein
MRIAALPRCSFNRLPAVFRGRGVRLRSLRAVGDAPKRGCLDSNRSACRRYFTGMIIGYPFGVITVITHLCTSVLLALDAQ